MPQLPQYQRQISGSNQLRVVGQARSRDDGEVLGRAVSQAGRAITAFENALDDARAKSEIVKANSSFRKEYDAIYRELEQDGEGDYREFENRFVEKAQDVQNRVLGDLKTQTAKTLMGERAISMRDDYTIRVRTLQRTRGISEVKATISGQIEDYRQSAEDVTTPMDRLAEVRGETESYVAAMHRAGFLNDQEVEAFSQDAEAIAVQGATKRHQLNTENLLDAGRTHEAIAYLRKHYNDMDVATRDAFMQAAEAKAQGIDAIAAGDQIFDAANGDLERALSRVGDIDNPEQRRRVEQRIRERKSLEDAADAEVMREASTALERMVYVEGGSIDDAPVSLLMRADPGVVNALKNFERKSRAAPAIQTDFKAFVEFKTLIDERQPDEARKYLFENIDKFSASDREAFFLETQNPKDVPDGFLSPLQVVTIAADQAGLKKDKDIDAAKVHLSRWAAQFEEENGRPPSEEELREQAEQDLVRRRFTKPGPFNNDERGRLFMDNIEIGNIPKPVLQAVVPLYPETVPQEEIVKDLAEVLRRFGEVGVDNPTPEEIAQVIPAIIEMRGEDE